MMTEAAELRFQQQDTFWQLIERTHAASHGDIDKQAELIIGELVQYPAEAIIEFDFVLRDWMANAYRRDLWHAAHIINCWCSDDSFSEFRAWLIAQGKAIYDAALEDPEILVDIVAVGQETFAFDVEFAAEYAYQRKTGKEIPPSPSHRAVLLDDVDFNKNLSGDERKAQLAQYYPKLHAKFGDCAGLF